MSSSSARRIRQYIGLGVVILAYVGGILGWSWAVRTVNEPSPSTPDTTAVSTMSEPAGTVDAVQVQPVGARQTKPAP